ncbi:MAG: hypothetical protein HUJ29_00470 [Gammaproteobacteria bacterium]|nr:hypothetical protein [Gammaproteobacteria bacterium]
MKYVFIVNRQARDGQLAMLWEKAEPTILARLDDTQVCYPQDARETRRLAALHAARGDCCLVSVGGEGTMNLVVQGIIDSDALDDVCMALIPFGNVNDYAAALGMKKTWQSALEALVQGQTRKVGLIEMITPGTRNFALNIADIGFGAATAKYHVIDRQLRWCKGRFKYNLLALKTLLHWKNVPARITIDDEVLEGDIVIALAGFSPTLGGFRLLPQASVFDDRFAVTIGRDTSKREILKLLNAAKKDRIAQCEKVILTKAQRVVVEPRGEFVAMVDGEIIDCHATRVEFVSHAQRLNFIVPAHSPVPEGS